MLIRKSAKAALVLALSTSLTGCANWDDYKQLSREQQVYIVAAVLIWGAIVAAGAKAVNRSGSGVNYLVPPPSGGGPITSDIRLKREVRHIATLESGMKLYTFKYLDSDTTYVGVMAQDLLLDPSWRNAVVTSPSGYYSVDYEALGFRLVTVEEWREGGSMTRISAVDAASNRPLRLRPTL